MGPASSPLPVPRFRFGSGKRETGIGKRIPFSATPAMNRGWVFAAMGPLPVPRSPCPVPRFRSSRLHAGGFEVRTQGNSRFPFRLDTRNVGSGERGSGIGKRIPFLATPAMNRRWAFAAMGPLPAPSRKEIPSAA